VVSPHQHFFLSENYDERSFIWYKNVGISSFVLSQITRLTERRTDGRKDGALSYG